MSSLWNFTIDDTSPFLTYSPYADGSGSGLANGWIPWYTGSGFVTTPGEGGAGDSYHLTSLSGSSVNFEFWGTAVYLYGLSNSSYDAVIDTTTSSHAPTSSDVLFSATGLKEGSHSVTLTARPTGSQQLAFDRAVISAPFDNPPVELFYDNSDTSVLQYSGNWTVASAPGIPNATVSHPWRQTVEKDASVTMEISGAVGVSIYGMSNWGNWLYTTTVDDQVTTYNSSTFWKVPDSLLFYQVGLDPNKNHTVTLTNITPQMKLNLNSFRVYKTDLEVPVASISTGGTGLPTGATGGAAASSPTSSSGSSAASMGTSSSKHSVNAGVVVGPIIAVVVVAIIGWFLWKRLRSRRNMPHLGDADLTDELEKREPHRPIFPVASYADRGKMSAASFASPSGASTSLSWAPTTAAIPMAPNHANANVSTPVYSPVQSPTTGTTPSNGTTVFSFSDSRSGKMGAISSPPPPPPQTAPSAPAAISGLDSHDVDRLVELIAQRIDPVGRQSDGIAPPEYRGMV
ncbi:hypothetical protein C8F01DRAFT_1107083 [Mycena amicta]|nr:hypothetical protein C8F01DRAFT_1107083 [Mycena amicta]